MAVSCGGRPDLAGDAIAEVRVPTLLIVRAQHRRHRERREPKTAETQRANVRREGCRQVVGRPGAGVRDRRLGPQVAPALHDNLHHGLQPTRIWQVLCWRGSSEPTTCSLSLRLQTQSGIHNLVARNLIADLFQPLNEVRLRW